MANVGIATLTAKLVLDAKGFTAGIDSASKSLNTITKDNAWSKLGQGLNTVAKAAIAVGATMTTAAGLAVDASSDFESAFTGVTKTVDTSMYQSQEEIDSFFKTLREGILDMSERLPVAAEDIAEVAAAAGQLGIHNENILGFTEAMIGLGSATNLSAQEAAVALAQFANVTKMSQTDFDRLSSSIVALGNSMATDEKQIVTFATELANLKQSAGMSEADIMGLSAAFASLGLDAAASGTAMQRLTQDITRAVAEGGESLDVFANTSGMTAEEFAKAWEEDATNAFLKFIEGLGSKSTSEQLQIFDELGIKQQREIDMLQRLAGNSQLVKDAVDISNQAWKENTALTDEVNKRNETFESKTTMLKNSVHELAITVGDALKPKLEELMDKLMPIIDKVTEYVSQHPEVIQNLAETGVKLLAIGSATSGIIKLITSIGSLITAVKTIGSAISLITGGGAAAGAAGAAGAVGGGGLLAGLLSGLTALGPVILGVGAAVGIFAIGWHNDWFGCQETFNQVYEETGSKVEAFKAVLRSVGDQIAQKVSEIASTVGDWWTGTAVPWFDQVFTKIGTWLVEIWTKISTWFTTGIEKIKSWLQTIWTNVSNSLTKIKNDATQKLTTIWNTVTQKMTSIVNTVSQKMTSIWNTVKEKLTSVWNTFKEKLTSVWDTVKEKFTSVWDTVKEKMTSVWDTVKEKLTSVWDTVKEKMESIWTTVTEKLGEIWNETVNKLSDIWNEVSDKLNGIWNEVQNKLSDIWNEVTNKLSDIWNEVTNKMGDIWNTVKEKMTNVKDEVVNKVQELKDKAYEGLQNVKETFANIFQTIYETVKNKIQQAVDAVRSAVDAIGAFIRRILDAIGSAISKAKELIGIGRGGGRAAGGPVSAGTPYVVGEEGPELFVPRSNGYIIPADETAELFGAGKAQGITIVIQGDVYDDQASMRRKLRGAVLDVLREQVAYG